MCIHRPAKSSDRDYVKIISSSTYCALSVIGRRGGKQLIRFDTTKSDCYNLKSVLHEFVHTIGFHHEHNRPDRDKYVTINWKCIQKNKTQHFNKGLFTYYIIT